ncbi:MAG TPA: hypothetical protein LFW21_03195 [Rickettsia endosymbiont of Pyrocoelia pectoralis]|nr:hypothetical protein [Rickettsia endosymbiont of Pyrocoelia pectoralis]
MSFLLRLGVACMDISSSLRGAEHCCVDQKNRSMSYRGGVVAWIISIAVIP